jgi:hypothetical protein
VDSQSPAELVAKQEVEYGAIVGAIAVGVVLIYLGIAAFDPTWKVGPITGHAVVKVFKIALAWLSEHTSAPVRGSIVIGVGVLSFLLAILLVLDAVLWRKPLLIVDADGVESLSEKGKGRLAWKDISAVHEIEKTLVINGAGPDAMISVGTEEIDKTVDEIYAVIAHHRPEVLPGRQAAAGSKASPA